MIFGIYILLIYQLFFVQSLDDHYWREYDGTIPSDAIPADDTEAGVSYIGQVYVENKGLWAGTITPGSMKLRAEPGETFVGKELTIMDESTKILCAKDHSKFVWLNRTTATFETDLRGHMPVIGGYHYGRLVFYIGRIRVNEHAIIGNIQGSSGIQMLYFSSMNGEIVLSYTRSQFEVLVYRNTSVGWTLL